MLLKTHNQELVEDLLAFYIQMLLYQTSASPADTSNNPATATDAVPLSNQNMEIDWSKISFDNLEDPLDESLEAQLTATREQLAQSLGPAIRDGMRKTERGEREIPCDLKPG